MLDRLGGTCSSTATASSATCSTSSRRRSTARYLYADDQVLAIDGGIYDGGPCLVVELPVSDDAVMRKPAAEDSTRPGRRQSARMRHGPATARPGSEGRGPVLRHSDPSVRRLARGGPAGWEKDVLKAIDERRMLAVYDGDLLVAER